jgi:hypothetical protein
VLIKALEFFQRAELITEQNKMENEAYSDKDKPSLEVQLN